MSWYAKDDAEYKGSRITLIDISPSSSTYLTYRHILLVQPDIPTGTTNYTQYGSYAPLKVHAGGIAYFKGKIYLSSTNLGVRIFDLDKIIEVSTGDATNDKCGKDTNGNLFAFNYRYILPQIGYQKISNASPFSTIQVNDEGTQLWTGQYYAGSADASIVPKVFGFPIDAGGKLQNSGIVSVSPKNSLFADNHAHGIQGYSGKETEHGSHVRDLQAILMAPTPGWQDIPMELMTLYATDGPMVQNLSIMNLNTIICGALRNTNPTPELRMAVRSTDAFLQWIFRSMNKGKLDKKNYYNNTLLFSALFFYFLNYIHT